MKVPFSSKKMVLQNFIYFFIFIYNASLLCELLFLPYFWLIKNIKLSIKLSTLKKNVSFHILCYQSNLLLYFTRIQLKTLRVYFFQISPFLPFPNSSSSYYVEECFDHSPWLLHEILLNCWAHYLRAKSFRTTSIFFFCCPANIFFSIPGITNAI